MVKFSCRICQKVVGKKNSAICYDLCKERIHTAWNNLDKKNLQTLTTLHYKMVLYKFHKKKVPLTIQTNQELEKNLQWKIS